MRLMYQGPTIDAVHFRLWLGKRVILYACCRSSRAVPSMELPFTLDLFQTYSFDRTLMNESLGIPADKNRFC